jgi:hypothetical protein
MGQGGWKTGGNWALSGRNEWKRESAGWKEGGIRESVGWKEGGDKGGPGADGKR